MVEIGEMKVVDLGERTVAGAGTQFAGTGLHCCAEYGGERGIQGVVHQTPDFLEVDFHTLEEHLYQYAVSSEVALRAR
jgi:hypothetical protein